VPSAAFGILANLLMSRVGRSTSLFVAGRRELPMARAGFFMTTACRGAGVVGKQPARSTLWSRIAVVEMRGRATV